MLFPQIAYWVYPLLLELKWGREKLRGYKPLVCNSQNACHYNEQFR